MSRLVALKKVFHRYDSGFEIRFPDVSLDSGSSMMILGRSGVGKTTLLHVISGLLPPTSGIVQINNQNIYQLTASRLDKFRGENIGIIFQRPHFFTSLTAIENLKLSSSFQAKKVSEQSIKRMLDRLEIGDKANNKINELSQGQLQRLSIARACINSPTLILADEPTSALDDENAMSVMEVLKEMQDQVGAGLIIVTHDHRIQSKVDQTISLTSSYQSIES